MKKIIFIAIFAFSVQITFAQNPNPFKSIGKPAPEFLSLTNGKYPEIFENDTLRKIGSVMFNTRTNKIEYFIETDTMYSEATLRPEIVSRWLSRDPLARKYPSMSPYNFVANSPIMATDPDGRDVVYINGFSFHDNNNKARGGAVNSWRKNKYWNTDRNFTNDVNNYFNDNKNHFLSASQIGGKASVRQKLGFETALQMVKSGEIKLSADNPITVVMHSQGNAYGVGYMQGILAAAKKLGIDVDVNGVMLSVHQPDDIDMTDVSDKIIQFTYSNDNSKVVSPMGNIDGVENANTNNAEYKEDGLDAHSATINESEAFNAIKKTDSKKKIFTKKKKK